MLVQVVAWSPSGFASNNSGLDTTTTFKQASQVGSVWACRRVVGSVWVCARLSGMSTRGECTTNNRERTLRVAEGDHPRAGRRNAARLR